MKELFKKDPDQTLPSNLYTEGTEHIGLSHAPEEIFHDGQLSTLFNGWIKVKRV